jgi:Zn-dependent M28 family amino/carboxypeptidase
VPEAAPAAVASGLVAVLAGVPLLLLQDVGNASRGAIDNASGVGLVLHLAECLTVGSEWRGKLCVKVLITGAEEWGVMGATAYVRAHAGELQRQAGAGGLHILNFDGVGIRGQLRHVGAGRGRLLDFVRAACRESGLAIRGFKFVGALADHIPFAEEGLDALSLITMGRAAWSVHTRHDSADKLDAEGFRKAGEVAQGVVKWLARGPAPGSPRWSGL